MSDESTILKPLLERLTEPSTGEVLGAKKAVLDRAADGRRHGHEDLLFQYTKALGIEAPTRESNGNKNLNLTALTSIEEDVDRENPVITYWRLIAASLTAIYELVTDGVLDEIGERRDRTISPTLSWQLGGTSSGVQWVLPAPSVDAWGYRLSRRYREHPEELGLQPDLLTERLDVLALDQRSQRCLVESVEAFHRRLYLASANLLGAASEGAWYAAGERLRPQSEGTLGKLLDADTSPTARLQVAVVAILRQAKGLPKSRPDELHSHGSLLRALRDYGVHPRADVGDMETYFTEAGCRLLLLTSFRYLEQLEDAVSAAVTSPPGSPLGHRDELEKPPA